MALVERVLDPELPIIAGDDSRALPETGANDGLNARRRLDLDELRGHVAVGRTVSLLMGDGDARLGRHREALIAHRLAECIRAGDQSHSRELTALEIIKNFFTRHSISVRSLEDPLVHRLDDLHGAG